MLSSPPTPATPTSAPPALELSSAHSTLYNIEIDVWRRILLEADFQTSLLRDGRLVRGIHRKVDVSEEALTTLFNMLDREDRGYLNKSQFLEGLNRCLLTFGGGRLPSDFGPVEVLWQEASTNNHTHMSREAFFLIIRRLKIEILLPWPKESTYHVHNEEGGQGHGHHHEGMDGSSSSSSSVGSLDSRSGTTTPRVVAAMGGGGVAPHTPASVTPSSPGMAGWPSAPPALLGYGSGQQTMLKNDQLDEDLRMKVFDFTKHQMHKRDVFGDRLREFFLTKHTKDIKLRWVMCENHDYTNILRLAIKYSIHNLHLEDVLKLESQKPKITHHGRNHFVIIPILRLTRETEKALNAWVEEHHDDVGIDKHGRRKTPFPIMLEEATVGVFSAGPPENDSTVITIRTKWRGVNNKTGLVKMAMRKDFPSSQQQQQQREKGKGGGVGGEGGGEMPFSPSLHATYFRHRPQKAQRQPTSTSSTASKGGGGGGGGGSYFGFGVRQRSNSTTTTTAAGGGGGGIPLREQQQQQPPPPSSTRSSQSTTNRRNSIMLKDMLARKPRKDHTHTHTHTSTHTTTTPSTTNTTNNTSPPAPASAPARTSVRVLASTLAGDMTKTLRETLGGVLPAVVGGGGGGGGGGGVNVDVQDEELADWEDIFVEDGGGGDDQSSVNTEMEEEDLYFDVQMMQEVAESVYQTTGSVHGNAAEWLLHNILDHTVDRLIPIVESYQIRVSYYQDMLHQRGANFSKGKTKDVMDIKLDLLWLVRRVALLKPILRHLLRMVPPELQLYYQDVDDHLERCLEGLSGLINTAQSIVDEAYHYRESRINDILFIITIITSIFTPANFLAGVFGMNFRHGDQPGMPELTWKRGYLWFWLWSFILSGGVLGIVLYKVRQRGKYWG